MCRVVGAALDASQTHQVAVATALAACATTQGIVLGVGNGSFLFVVLALAALAVVGIIVGRMRIGIRGSRRSSSSPKRQGPHG